LKKRKKKKEKWIITRAILFEWFNQSRKWSKKSRSCD